MFVRLSSALRLFMRPDAARRRILKEGQAIVESMEVSRELVARPDVREFVEASRRDVDPVQLAHDLNRDFEQTLSDHRMTRDQLETPVSV